jgi:hypothetical protein
VDIRDDAIRDWGSGILDGEHSSTTCHPTACVFDGSINISGTTAARKAASSGDGDNCSRGAQEVAGVVAVLLLLFFWGLEWCSVRHRSSSSPQASSVLRCLQMYYVVGDWYCIDNTYIVYNRYKSICLSKKCTPLLELALAQSYSIRP